MVSLKTIAKQCGVSTATVSKALNDQKDISEETKIRVRETAEQLGYFPNAAARALKTNRSYNIGVLFEEEAGSGLTHEYFSGVLNGFKTQAEKMGYDIAACLNAEECADFEKERWIPGVYDVEVVDYQKPCRAYLWNVSGRTRGLIVDIEDKDAVKLAEEAYNNKEYML